MGGRIRAMTMQKFVGVVCFLVVFGPLLLPFLVRYLVCRHIRWNRRMKQLSEVLYEYEQNKKWRDLPVFEQF